MKPFFYSALKFLGIIAVLVVVIFVFNKLTKSNLFKIRTVKIYGNPKLLSDISSLRQNMNLIYFNGAEVEQVLLTKNPWIKFVEFSKSYPNTLHIKIIERIPVVEATYQQRIGYIDQAGKLLFPQTQKIEKNYPKLDCAQLLVNQDYQIQDESLISGIKIIDQLDEIDFLHIQSLNCGQNHQSSIYIDNVQIIYPSNKNISDLVTSLQLLFKQFRIEGKYPKRVNLSFDKPVLKYQEMTDQEASVSGDEVNSLPN